MGQWSGAWVSEEMGQWSEAWVSEERDNGVEHGLVRGGAMEWSMG